MSKLWWLSFCDTDRPVGQRFLGVAIVEGTDLASAITEAWERQCNPGGEVLSHHTNKLMSRDEIDGLVAVCSLAEERGSC